MFDVDAVDLADLFDEQVDVLWVFDVDRQLIDRPTSAALEDVDTDHIGADRADATRDRAECARAIRKPNTNNE